MLIKNLSSIKVTFFLLLGWFFSIIYSYFYIPPRDDDGIYFYPALTVLNDYPPGFFVDQILIPVFFIFPLQPFLNGIFLSFFEPNLYNYNLFNLIFVLPTLILVGFFLKEITSYSKQDYLAINVFLILISITPFSTNFYVNRPENIGLFFLFLGLFLFTKNYNAKNIKILNFIFLHFVLGLSAICHPSFIILTFPIIAYITFILFKSKTSFLIICAFLMAFILPITLFSYWFLINIDTSIDQLFNRANEINPNNNLDFLNGLILIFRNTFFLSEESLIQKFYHSFFMISSFIGIVCFLLTIFNFKKVFSSPSKIILSIITISSFIIILILPSYPPTILVFTFFLTIFLTFFLVKKLDRKNINIQISYKNFIFTFFTTGLMLVFTLLPIFTHLIKVNLSDKKYFNSQNTNSVVSNNLNNTKLIITTPQLIPTFASIINKNIKEKNDSFYWIFPGGQRQKPFPKMKKLFSKDIDNILKFNFKNQTIWGISKRDISYYNSNDVCIKIRGNLFAIFLHDVLMIYEDRDNIFFKPSSFKKLDYKGC